MMNTRTKHRLCTIWDFYNRETWYCRDCLGETFYPASGILSHTVQSFTIWARNYENRMESLIARETFPRSSDLDFQNYTNVRLWNIYFRFHEISWFMSHIVSDVNLCMFCSRSRTVSKSFNFKSHSNKVHFDIFIKIIFPRFEIDFEGILSD